MSDIFFGESPTTTTEVLPALQPATYDLQRALSYQWFPPLLAGRYPTYPNNIDPGLSPSMQGALQMAQGYASSPAPSILGQSAGALGQFMNPANGMQSTANQLMAPFLNPFANNNPLQSRAGSNFFPLPGQQNSPYPGSLSPWANQQQAHATAPPQIGAATSTAAPPPGQPTMSGAMIPPMGQPSFSSGGFRPPSMPASGGPVGPGGTANPIGKAPPTALPQAGAATNQTSLPSSYSPWASMTPENIAAGQAGRAAMGMGPIGGGLAGMFQPSSTIRPMDSMQRVPSMGMGPANGPSMQGGPAVSGMAAPAMQGGPAISGMGPTASPGLQGGPVASGGPGQIPQSQVGPTSIWDVYQAASGVMNSDRDKQISQALGQAGFSGNRYGSSTAGQVAQIGADTALRQNNLFTDMLYRQGQEDLNRQLSASGQILNTGSQDWNRALQAAQAGPGLASAYSGIQSGRLGDLFNMARYEQDRADRLSMVPYQDYINSRLGYLPAGIGILGGGATPIPGGQTSTTTGGGAGLIDLAMLAAQIYGLSAGIPAA